MRALLLILASLTLAACGGGGNDTPAKPCEARVEVGIYGDSTNWGLNVDAYYANGSILQSPNAPPLALQKMFDKTFGVDRVKVNNFAKNGESLRSFLAAGGKIAPGLSIANWGINDSGWPIEEFRSNLDNVSPTFFETPNPIDLARWTDGPQNFSLYVEAVRKKSPLLDTNAYVLSIPNWQKLMADGSHPGDELYGRITRDVLFPALSAQVSQRLCK